MAALSRMDIRASLTTGVVSAPTGTLSLPPSHNDQKQWIMSDFCANQNQKDAGARPALPGVAGRGLQRLRAAPTEPTFRLRVGAGPARRGPLRRRLPRLREPREIWLHCGARGRVDGRDARDAGGRAARQTLGRREAGDLHPARMRNQWLSQRQAARGAPAGGLLQPPSAQGARPARRRQRPHRLRGHLLRAPALGRALRQVRAQEPPHGRGHLHLRDYQVTLRLRFLDQEICEADTSLFLSVPVFVLRYHPANAAVEQSTHTISNFLGPSPYLSLSDACKYGSIALLEWIWDASCTRPADRAPGWSLSTFLRSDPHYRNWQFAKSLEAAASRGDLPMVEWIFAHFSGM
ncbi:hypothetical protein ON010_g2484 [Phytophthora cinnamomi]|nr:hypothetical protein ON010_g2484 [Phytophthora cinnamomi]